MGLDEYDNAEQCNSHDKEIEDYDDQESLNLYFAKWLTEFEKTISQD
jgi:hypothetical protein